MVRSYGSGGISSVVRAVSCAVRSAVRHACRRQDLRVIVNLRTSGGGMMHQAENDDECEETESNPREGNECSKNGAKETSTASCLSRVAVGEECRANKPHDSKNGVSNNLWDPARMAEWARCAACSGDAGGGIFAVNTSQQPNADELR